MKKIDDTEEIYDGFEGDSLSEIWDTRKFEFGSVGFQSKIVRKGKKALKITLRKGDKFEAAGPNSKKSERDELLENKYLGPKENRTYSYSFSVFIPKDFPIVPTRLILAQWKQHDEGDKGFLDMPVLALRYQKGSLMITLQTSEERQYLFTGDEDIKNKWIDFKFHVKFTRKKSGLVKVWMNKKKVVDYKGITAYSEKYNYPRPGLFYFKMGLYRDRMDEPMTIYIDEFRKKRLK